MMLYDSVEVLSKPRITKDGFLVAEAHVARTGVQVYLASELGFDGDPSRRVNVYRPPEEVFAADAMASYAHRPITVDHPAVLVDASNWKEYSKGQTGDEVLRDGEKVRVPVMLMDGKAINEWNGGKKQLSMGYTMDLKVVDGVAPDGQKYEAVQQNLRMNHLALVPHARGGSDLRLGDNHNDRKSEDSSMSEQTKLTTVTVDGLSVETTEPGATAITRLIGDVEAANKALNDATESHNTAMKAKDKELAQKDAEIDTLKAATLSDEDLDKKVTERADLIADAKQIANLDYTGDSADQIRSKAVSAKVGSAAIDGKSTDYIAARFDMLSEDAKADPVRKVVRSGADGQTTDAESAYDEMVADKGNQWRGEQS